MISTGAEPAFESVMLVLAVLPTATWPKLTVLDDTVSVPVARVFSTMDPEQPLRARLQNKKKSSPMFLCFKWRIYPPNAHCNFIGARTKLIAKAHKSNHIKITNVGKYNHVIGYC